MRDYIFRQNLRIINYFFFNGYFCEDPLNLSRIGGIFQKKSDNLNKMIESLEVNDYFKKAYIQQVSLRDFIVLTEAEIIQKCSSSFDELQVLKNKTISSLVKDFLEKKYQNKEIYLHCFYL